MKVEGERKREGKVVKDEETTEAENERDFRHSFFFVKYLCPQNDCGGTMAALPGKWSIRLEKMGMTKPSDYVPSGIMECNSCGRLRTEEEFVADLEQHQIL